MTGERLQKVLAAADVASRRASEALIAAGRVTVDGRIARLGDVVDPATAHIEVDGRPIGEAARKVYLLQHKPAGVTSTTRDPHAESTVLELVPTALVPDGARLYPVGRLDLDSEGLLLLTNDGAWSERVLHPRFGVEREYAVGLADHLAVDAVQALEAGIELDEGLAVVHHLRPMTGVEARRLADLLRPAPSPSLVWYRATLRQGWKRQLRRMFGAVGAPIVRLVRVRIGPVRIDGLASGRTRALKAPEVRGLAGGGGRSRERGANPAGPSAGPKRRGETPSRSLPDLGQAQAPARSGRPGHGGDPARSVRPGHGGDPAEPRRQGKRPDKYQRP